MLLYFAQVGSVSEALVSPSTTNHANNYNIVVVKCYTEDDTILPGLCGGSLVPVMRYVVY